ncbi:MAG: hypothetical protein KDI51_07755 [Xanthomonadales bacterium]|nr:hypothetical protein [Xanthomonadales bacterium]MCB1634470.1 hypothetical protein [Xanthomonadales bacterium]
MLTVLLLALAGTTEAPVDAQKPFVLGDLVARTWMVGRWRGEVRTDDGYTRIWELTRTADGTFETNFCIACGTAAERHLVEYGRWGVSGPVYFTITEGWIGNGRRNPVDPNDESLYDAYYIVEAKGDSMTYRNAATGNEFTIRREAQNH